jgi:hypothetical protein
VEGRCALEALESMLPDQLLQCRPEEARHRDPRAHAVVQHAVLHALELVVAHEL